MKKMKKLASLLLVLVMSLALTVPAFAATRDAYQPYDSDEDLVSNAAGYSYWIGSTLYSSIFGSSRYASVSVREKNGNTIPAGYIEITPTLCNASGSIKIIGSSVSSSGKGTHLFANTKTSGDPEMCYATGVVIVEGRGKVNAPKATDARSRQAVDALTKTLTEDGKYPVNACGETYGSLMLASEVGHVPDLLSAVGSSGVDGYIRLADLIADHAAGDSLPLYDLEGNVIGAFVV